MVDLAEARVAGSSDLTPGTGPADASLQLALTWMFVHYRPPRTTMVSIGEARGAGGFDLTPAIPLCVTTIEDVGLGSLLRRMCLQHPSTS